MTTTTTANKVKINKMDKATYDSATKSNTELYLITDESFQYSAFPTASASFLGKIAQYVGTTNSTYTNGYFYKCVSDGQSPATYSWEAVQVQSGGSGTSSYTDLTNKPSINNVTLTGNKTSAQLGIISNYTLSGLNITSSDVSLGTLIRSLYEKHLPSGSYVVGGVELTDFPDNRIINAEIQISIKDSSLSNVQVYDILLSSLDIEPYFWYTGYRTDSSTAFGLEWVPVSNQYSSMPSAASVFNNRIVQFTGTTTASYTNGHFYKCVSDGQTPATYSWEEVSLGGASYTAGNGIDITSGVISVASPTLTNAASGSGSIAIGQSSSANGVESVAIGQNANVSNQKNYNVIIGARTGAFYDPYNVCVGYGSMSIGGYNVLIGSNTSTESFKSYGIAIGYQAKVGESYTIQLGKGTNSTVGTLAVGLTTDGTNYNNYELLSADGTIPSARLTNAISSTTGSLVVADWSSNTQTINVTGVTATNTVWVSPAPASASDYANAGIICTAQGAGTLTFTCTTVPTNAITVNVAIN